MKKVCLLAAVGLFITSTLHASFVVHEKFATDPALDGWQVFGDTNLFQWDSTNQVMDVTWDSTQANSYFYHPLDRTYTMADSFCIQFDLQLNDATATVYGSELAVGLIHYADATNPNYSRTLGTMPNIWEFDYFPPDQEGDLASDDVTEFDTNALFYFVYDNLQPTPGVTYRLVLVHQAGSLNAYGVMYANGVIVSTLPLLFGELGVGDFQVDTLSISSYLDDGYGDDILAHGTVGNLSFASPLPIGLIQTNTASAVSFTSDTNWLYTIEQSQDLQTWTAAGLPTMGNGTNLWLQATNPPNSYSLYRVRADLP